MPPSEAWQRWAEGDTITVDKLRDSVEVLTAVQATLRGELYRALGQALHTWAHNEGIDLRSTDRRPPAPHHTGHRTRGIEGML